MEGFTQFMQTFGGISLGTVITVALAIVFLIKGYKRWRDYLMKKHDAEQQHRAELKEALDGVRSYPQYREQSRQIQLSLENEIKDLNIKYATLSNEMQCLAQRLDLMEEQARKKDLSILKDKIIERYKYYTDLEINPTQTWNEMEAESFWELFREYESRGGNGYIHKEVQPKMVALKVVSVGQPTLH